MGDQILLTFTGRDAPGITAQLSRILAQSGARLDDVEQVVVQGFLVLGFAVETADVDLLVRELLFAAKTLGLELENRRLPADSGEPPRGYALTALAARVGA